MKLLEVMRQASPQTTELLYQPFHMFLNCLLKVGKISGLLNRSENDHLV